MPLKDTETHYRPRYISLAPSTTEILFALGLEENIVGVSASCNYPPATQGKEKVGTFSNPNIEKILSLHPDYVFCTGLEQAPVTMVLRQLHIPVYVADPKTVEAPLVSIQQIGSLATAEEATRLITQIKED